MARPDKKSRGLYKQPKSDCWYYDFTLNGERFRGSTGLKNKAASQEYVESLKTDARRQGAGFRIAGKEPTFAELACRYLKITSEKKSYDRDIRTAELFISFFGMEKKLSQIENNEILIHQFIKQRSQGDIEVKYRYGKSGKFTPAKPKHLNPSKRTSVNRDLAQLRSMFNHAVLWGMCSKSPIRKGMFSHAAEQAAMKTEFLEIDEIDAYLKACAPQYYPVALMALSTGCRRGEILNLRWKDVNISQSVIVLKQNKSGKMRTVFTPEPLTKELALLKCMSDGNDDSLVFQNRDGHPYKDIRSAHRHALLRSGLYEKRKAAGKVELRFHDLRHSFASALAVSCHDLVVVQRALGHADLKTTQRYAHLTSDRFRSEIEKLSEAISGTLRHTSVIPGNFGSSEEVIESEKSLCFSGILASRPHSSDG